LHHGGGTSGQGLKSLRGGSWNNNENNARVSIRNNNNPHNRNNNIGFRAALFHSFANIHVIATREAGKQSPRNRRLLRGARRHSQ